MTVNFFVPGQPQGKERPRFAGGHAYTPRKTVEYEGQIAAYYWKAVAESHGVLNESQKLGPIRIAIKAVFPVPVSDSKATKAKKLANEVRPKAKPDCDNIGKAVLDALNKFAYNDDAQVYRLEVLKEFGEEPGLFVTVIHEGG